MASQVRTRAIVQWIGLVGGPVLAGVCYLLLPESYTGVTGAQVEFSSAGRVTLEDVRVTTQHIQRASQTHKR